MDEKTLKELDNIINVAIINLYTISKRDNIIRLENIDYNDDRHWVILNLISYLCTYMDKTAYLEISLWQFLRLRLRIKNKRIKRKQDNGGMTCNCFISDIEDAYPSITDPFLTIAKLYYPRKRNKK